MARACVNDLTLCFDVLAHLDAPLGINVSALRGSARQRKHSLSRESGLPG